MMNNPSARKSRTVSLSSDSDDPRHIPPHREDHLFFVKERSIVFFNDWNIQIKEIERHCEHDKLWYSRTDYNLFGAHDNLIVKIARAGNFHETDEHSIRGLEKQLESSDTSNNMEEMAMEAVQQEQQRQYQHRINHPELIASIYRLASMSAKHEARIRGIQDALQVNQSPMLGFSIDGEYYHCDSEKKNTRRRKPRSRSMIHVFTSDVDHQSSSSSHRSTTRHSFHSHPITRADRKHRSSSLQAIMDSEIPSKREPSTPASRRKPRSVSMLGSTTSNSFAIEASAERLVASMHKPSSRVSSPRRTSRTTNDEIVCATFAFGKDAMTEECTPIKNTNGDKAFTKSPSKRETKQAGSSSSQSGQRSPRQRRSSIEHTRKTSNTVQ